MSADLSPDARVAQALVEQVRQRASQSARQQLRAEEPLQPEAITGKVIHLPPRPLDGSFKLEMNFGCELPVCVANRQSVKAEFIEVKTDDNVVWRLERTASSKLPAPEHYGPWLWFIDRLKAARDRGETKAPMIILDPAELFALFGGQRGGAQYRSFDEAFIRYSKLVIQRTAALRLPNGKNAQDYGAFGTLCYYRALRGEPDSQMVFEFEKGAIMPGTLLWASICSDYVKSIPLAPLRDLDYVGQRLYTYLSKHCQPGGEFEISASKLLPKIPMTFASDETKRQLKQHHQKLIDVGFLDDVAFEGKGKALKVIYKRR